MGSIQKIVSTPLKWASKHVLKRTLLRFPGGDSHDPIACTYCPELCRFACPTAVVSANDAVTPCNKMSLLHKEKRWPGRAADGGELWPLYDCTGCGRCTEFCVYEMPVMEQLFEARKVFAWEPAKKAALALTDQMDEVGDLADELGDTVNAERRLKKYSLKFAPGRCEISEPRSLYYARKHGVEATFSSEKFMKESPSAALQKHFSGKRWLVHESNWYNRHLDQASEMRSWIEKAKSVGIQLVTPFANGSECIDCGGEGAYSRLFPEQARQIAVDFWERDQHRVDGILCLSNRCAEHFRKHLGNDVPIFSLTRLFQEQVGVRG